MINYLYAVSKSVGESYVDLAESSSMVACTIARGLLYENFGQKPITVSPSLLDNSMEEKNLKDAAQTVLPPFFREEVKKLYHNSQPLAFYEGMFRAAVVVFSDAYQNKVKKNLLDSLLWNYAYIAQLITTKN